MPRFKEENPSWVKGTVQAVKDWLRKETEGMLPKEQNKAKFDLNTRKWVHEEPDCPDELRGQDPWFDYEENKWKAGTESRFKKVTGHDLPPTLITGTGIDPNLVPKGIIDEDRSGEQKLGNWKPTNPKDLLGVRKVSFCCVPFTVLAEIALGMQEGAMKYGRHNYRHEGVAFSTYIDATFRHLADCWEGEDVDPDSGVHHISKALSTLVVLRDAMLNDKCTDDRPIKPLNADWLKKLNGQASKLVDKYPQPLKPYTNKPLPPRN